MGKRSVEITVTPRQRVILKRVTRSKKAAQQLVERCRVVLYTPAQARDYLPRLAFRKDLLRSESERI